MRMKIIATIGPSSASKEVMEKMIVRGMDIARINFSHGTHATYREWRNTILKIAKKEKRTVKILQDLQGPRIRVGEMPPAGRFLSDGETVVFSTEPEKSKEVIYIDDPFLHLDIKAGEPLYLANGEMELVVRKIKGAKIFAEVVRGGNLFSRKSVNVPRTKLTTSGLTKKDKSDLAFALKEGVDYVAVSFVQSADDIRAARAIIGKKARIIAKIETGLALANIDAIIQASDAIMIARGDLGIEVPGERLPFIQKNLVRHAAWYKKGSIVATQMLLSMQNNPQPTRAEVSDVANAVWDGADAVMLSDETASGKYPARALRKMAAIVAQAEAFAMPPNYL